jgi:hypothetical protein
MIEQLSNFKLWGKQTQETATYIPLSKGESTTVCVMPDESKNKPIKHL